MIDDGAQGLGFQTRLPAVQHEDRIKRRNVERRSDASPQDHGSRTGIRGQADVRRERDRDQHGRVGQHAADAVTEAVVAPVVREQRVARIQCKSLLRVLRRDRSGLQTVTGAARSSVAAECLGLEEPLPLENQTGCRSGALVLGGHDNGTETQHTGAAKEQHVLHMGPPEAPY